MTLKYLDMFMFDGELVLRFSAAAAETPLWLLDVVLRFHSDCGARGGGEWSAVTGDRGVELGQRV